MNNVLIFSERYYSFVTYVGVVTSTWCQVHFHCCRAVLVFIFLSSTCSFFLRSCLLSVLSLLAFSFCFSYLVHVVWCAGFRVLPACSLLLPCCICNVYLCLVGIYRRLLYWQQRESLSRSSWPQRELVAQDSGQATTTDKRGAGGM